MDKPNILFIYSDQHRYDCVASNGHPFVQTPTMDRLGAEGARFTHAFTPIPMCVPARCSMLTGQWPARHGVIFNYDGETFRPLRDEQPYMPALVQMAGYHTVHVGRWHVDPKRTPLEFGFHDYVPGWRYTQWRRARGIPPTPSDQSWRGQVDPFITPEQSSLAWHADQVIGWLEQFTEEGDPFFLRWHMAEPHLANRPPEPYNSMYDPASIPPWPSFGDTMEGKPFMHRQMLRNWGLEDKNWDFWAPIVGRYLGEISLLDAQIGRVLDALDRLGLAENTMVIYTADHGDMCGGHGMVDKHCVMYDDIVRVPMAVRWPAGIPAGRVVDDFVSNAVDLPATLVRLAGAEVPETFQGVDILPACRGEGTTGRPDILSCYSGNQFGSYTQQMVRDRRWKYVWNATATDELYDLDTDPAELTNRAADPACADELKRLRARLAEWMEDTKDSLWNGTARKHLLQGRKP